MWQGRRKQDGMSGSLLTLGEGSSLQGAVPAHTTSELYASWLLMLWEKQGIVKMGFVAISGTSSTHGDSKLSFWCGRMWWFCHKSSLPSLWKICHTTSLHPSKSRLALKYFLICRRSGVMFQCILLLKKKIVISSIWILILLPPSSVTSLFLTSRVGNPLLFNIP